MKPTYKTEILLMIIIFWVVTLFFSVDIYPYFAGTYWLHLQNHKVMQARSQLKPSSMQREPTVRP
jgi:hypothetical protein